MTAADRLSSGLENVVRAVWKKDPIKQAGAGYCEDRSITVYLRTELGGFVARCIDAICSSIPLKQLMTVKPTGQCSSSWVSKIAVMQFAPLTD